jgi:hypothetical protein
MMSDLDHAHSNDDSVVDDVVIHPVQGYTLHARSARPRPSDTPP